MEEGRIFEKKRQNKIWLQSSNFDLAIAGHIVSVQNDGGQLVYRTSITLMCHGGGFIPLSDYMRALRTLKDRGEVLYQSHNGHVTIEGVSTAENGEKKSVMHATIRYRDHDGMDQEKSIVFSEDLFDEIRRKAPRMRADLADYERDPTSDCHAPSPPPEETEEAEEE